MKLKYISTPTDLGGTAIFGCGTIHSTEIDKTLTKLSEDIGLSFDLNENTLGSTGKREYSGDIDVVIPTDGIAAFRELLEDEFGKDCVSRHGNMIHLRYPIVGYNAEYKEALPRTGFVQIDFNFGNVEWQKFYHYSDANSEYKGAHRNLFIAAICAVTNVEPGPIPENTIVEPWDQFNRPTSVIRWKFGEDGLIQVNRLSQKDRDGNWMRKQKDIVLDGPYLDPYEVRTVLFPYSSHIGDLNSLETLMAAVKSNYGMTDQERIWKRAASNFYDWPQGKLFEYPPEIAAYLPPNDK
jgi:hypothetical protein